MDRSESRYWVISALLQASEPLNLNEVAIRCGMAEKEALPVLRELVGEELVVEGQLVPGKSGPQYCWGAHWERWTQRRVASSKRKLQTIVGQAETIRQEKLDINDEPVLAFYDYIINEYKPPKDKRFLVFLQCSVRRPFSSSPSHASMRRAIYVATGYDPRKDFEKCPVHVVVLASKIGPVPYELEGVYPANLGGGGVKHFDAAYYAQVKPILAERMAGYIMAHKGSYDRISSFTESRYGEVLEAARKIAGAEFRILPVLSGPHIVLMGRSIPRKYWETYWIQLYLEIVSWLKPTQRVQAETRLKELGVKYR
jgi:hypothetical protein